MNIKNIEARIEEAAIKRMGEDFGIVRDHMAKFFDWHGRQEVYKKNNDDSYTRLSIGECADIFKKDFFRKNTAKYVNEEAKSFEDKVSAALEISQELKSYIDQ